MSRAPVLVTGASGFCGRHVLAALGAGPTPTPVVALVRDLPAWHAMPWTGAMSHVTPLLGSLLAPEGYAAAPELAGGAAGLLHLAATVTHSRVDVAAAVAADVEAAGRMVGLAARLRCPMVMMSSSGVVGCSRDPAAAPDESAPTCDDVVGRWPYYAGKIAAEQRARREAAALGVTLTILRPPVLLGPDDHRHRSTATVARLLAGRVPFVPPGGMHYVDVRDVAVAAVAALRRPTPRPIYHLPGTSCSLRQFFVDVAAADRAHGGARAPRVALPMAPLHALARADGALGRLWRGRPLGLLPDPVVLEMAGYHWGLGGTLAADELGFSPRPGAETLADTVAWLRAA